ncbi:MAG TPA: TetR family transcriptional regulator [Mycobacterium sp.]|nr:TetR family transcriptional regulator [Mycobacterium sp.]
MRHISRRTRILEEVLSAVADGYEEVNIRDVAQRAGVAVGTIYRYFASKEHLLVSVLGRWLEDFERHVGPQLDDVDDPYARMYRVVDELHREVHRRPLLAEAMARAYVVADASVAVEVELVRSRLVDLFADAVSRGKPTESHIDVAGLLTDVLVSNLLALAHGRIQIGDIRGRLRLMVDLLFRRHGAAIGRPDWHGTRSVGEQSAHWFYDWAPRASSAARRRVRS